MALPLASLLLTVFLSFSQTLARETQTFIVRVDNDLKPSQFSSVEDWYNSTLQSLMSSNDVNTSSSQNPSTAFLHIYKTVFHGFSAELTPQQAQELKAMHGVLSVIPDRVYQIQTTRSPHFLGLDGSTAKDINGLLNESDYGSNVIIGLLDTGIWPERRSFHDENLGPIPSRWKGECVGGEHFPKRLCNKKLVGARYFNKGYRASFLKGNESIAHSARDDIGHGTHTASTAAGRAVAHASFLGFARGGAAGIAQKARIAMYRVCWKNGCAESDILAGFDRAVDDGVDVVSISLAPEETLSYEDDPLAVASFGAMERGIFVSAAAGNGGSTDWSVNNVSPWVTTVGASTIDRKFPAHLYLGDGTVITGSSLYSGDGLADTYWPLIYAGNASTSVLLISADCMEDTIKPELVRGKIVVCDSGANPRVSKGVVVKKAGGVGMVVANVAPWGEGLTADAYLLPALAVTESARAKLLAYLTTAKNPTATIAFRGTKTGTKPAPAVASFSSRGPNQISINVMKPDLIAPGVDILAAYPNGVSPSGTPEDPRRTEFCIESGTSMACPHVSGIAALLKGARPDWSPAVIRSALMTTAYTYDRYGNALLDEKDLLFSDFWAMGAGHVDPERALDPGLVYDLTADDYIDFLCVSNYSVAEIKVITRRAKVNCSQAQISNPWDVNYPAISVAFNASGPYDSEVVVVRRTVTNVGDTPSSYNVTVNNPTGVTATVDPHTLVFNQKGERKSYTVSIKADYTEVAPNTVGSEFGQLSWSDGKHNVTSPIIYTWLLPPLL